MDIISASDELVITDVGMTYLAYTFSEDYGRYSELVENIETLQQLSKEIKSIPKIYDIQLQEQENESFISITAQKPSPPPLSESKINNLSVESCKELIFVVIETLKIAREHNIYHLDIGFHTIGFDAGLGKVCIMDWYDSVLSVPTEPPFYISEYYPPMLQKGMREYSRTQLRQAENYQLCCFIDDLLQANGYPTPKVIRYGRSENEDRPTLETIEESISQVE